MMPFLRKTIKKRNPDVILIDKQKTTKRKI